MMQNNQPRRGLVEKTAPDMERSNHAEGVGVSVIDAAKVHNPKDLCKILDYFRYKVGTTLDAALATGILRNSITWYVAYLEDAGMLQAICIKRDRTTGYKAKHYSADPALWSQVDEPAAPQYPSLFGKEDLL